MVHQGPGASHLGEDLGGACVAFFIIHRKVVASDNSLNLLISHMLIHKSQTGYHFGIFGRVTVIAVALPDQERSPIGSLCTSYAFATDHSCGSTLERARASRLEMSLVSKWNTCTHSIQKGPHELS